MSTASYSEQLDKYKDFICKLPIMAHAIDSEDRLITVSNCWLEKMGYERDEVIGRKSTEFLSEKSKHFAENVALPEFYQKKCIENVSYQFIRKDKKIIDVLLSANSILADDGTFLCSLATIVDVTEQLFAEDTYAESEKTNQIAMEATNAGLYDWDLLTGEIYYSPGWKRILGYQDNELANDFSIWETLAEPGGVKKPWEMQLELIAQKKDRFELEFKMKHRDGHWVHILSRAKALFDHKGHAIRIVGTHVDITVRKKAEESLRKSEAKYKQLVQTASDAIYLISGGGGILEVNPATCLMLGREREEILNLDIQGIDPNFTVEEFLRHWEKIPFNEPQVFETEHQRRDGSLFPVEVCGQKFKIGDNVFYYGIARDVTERKKSEVALRESEEKFRALFQQAGGYCMILDPNTSDGIPLILDANDAACAAHGYLREDFIGRPVADIDDEDGKRLVKDRTAEIMTGEPFCMENTHVRKDGTTFPAEINAKRIDVADGRSLVLTTEYDITERKRAETVLLESQKELHNLLQTIQAGVVVHDMENNKVKNFNQAALNIFGLSEEEILEKSTMDPGWGFVGENGAQIAVEDYPVNIVKRTQKPLLDYVVGTTKPSAPELTWLIVQASPQFDHNGNLLEIIVSFMDITELKNIQHQLREKDKQLILSEKMESIGNLAGGIAHEFNNMLAIIIGNNELVMEALPQGSLARESTEEIRVAGLRARDVVKQLLTFSRQENAVKKVMDLKFVVQESMKLIRSSTPANIKIEQYLSADTYPVMGNDTQVNQLLINLCNNAVDAMPEKGGLITIELLNETIDKRQTTYQTEIKPGQYVKLMVSDNGIGMDSEILDRIFEPYFTTKDVGKGTGIGMAVVHGIVERHDGTLIVDSKPGRGTRFTLFLPAHNALFEKETDQQSTLPVGDEYILYVDDEPSIARLGKRLLESLGYTAESLTDPEKALDMVKSDPNKFDLLITDMAMPNMTGDQLVIETLKIRQNMPTIICTGYSAIISEKEAADIGVRSYIMKPINKSELAKVVRKVLDGCYD